MKGMAVAIHTALETLDLQLQAELDTFNAVPGNPQLQPPPVLEGDDVELSAVPSNRAYYFGGRETHYAFPAVELAVVDGTLSNPSVGQVSYELDAPLVMVIWVQDKEAKLPQLYEQLLGYWGCVLGVLLQPGSFGGGTTVDRVQFTHAAVDPSKRQYDYTTVYSILFFWLKDAAQS